ncbi:MAG: histidine kinase [Prolixibacteraceae bacterium]|nr:histidine kinase [Prolixibacteraceae bacterium]
MKKLTTLLFTCLITVLSFGQTIHFKQGDEFSYRSSVYVNNVFLCSDKTESNTTESIKCYQVNFKVEESDTSGYILLAEYEELNNYTRSIKGLDKQWKTGTHYEKNLMNKNTTLNFPEYIVEFNLTCKGIVSEPVLIKDSASINKNSHHFPDSVLLQIFNADIANMFIVLPENLRVGEQTMFNRVNYTISDIDKNIITFVYIFEESDVTSKGQFIYDTSKGLIVENNSYESKRNQTQVRNNYISSAEKNEIQGKSNVIQLYRRQLVMNNKEPFACEFKKNENSIDSVFTETNVSIRGKIINTVQNSKVSIEWNESVPNGYNRYSISVPLNADSTFEIRLKLDEMQQVKFVNYEIANFYLTPGDDLYLEVDMNAFDETIVATGVGANNLNFSFTKYLYEEGTDLPRYGVYVLAKDKYADTLPKDFKSFFFDLLKEKQDYLNNNCTWLSPEQYLAEFWESQIAVVSILKNYPQKQEYYREQANKEPYIIDKNNYYDFYNLIHPDNDMMSYCSNYEHFIREYVFFFLDQKMQEITGLGNVINVSNYFDQLYQMRYGLSNSLFTGTSQYILKYKTVTDALQRSSWDSFVELYDQFIAEYPNAHQTTLIKEAYQRAEKVSPGKPAFNFELSDFEGNNVKLSDFKGKAIYIDFWSTSCGPCIASIERYGQEMQEAFKDTDVVLMYIALESDVTKPKEFMEKQGIKGIQLIAKGDEEAVIRDKFFFNGIPHYYLIDRNGNIVNREAPSPYQVVKDHSLVLSALDVQLNEDDNQQTIYLLKLIASILGGVLLLVVAILFMNKRANKRKLKLSGLNTKVRELELTAIKAQMNPHFMYNCLNSIQNLVQQQRTKEAHTYISKFAEMIRNVLKYSDRDEISLAEEIEMAKNYVKLEQLRFDINFEVHIADNLDLYSIFIPPLLLQPIIENAILHGLTPKSGDKVLILAVETVQNYICIKIEDNGIGRKAARLNRAENNGKGLGFSKERLEMLKEKHNANYKFEMIDLTDAQGNPSGTRIEICLAED